MDYVDAIGLENIHDYERTLMAYALRELQAVPDLQIYGPQERLGVIAFNLGKHHAYDVGSFLDNYGIAVRTGHHCAMPLMEFTACLRCVARRSRCTIPKMKWTGWWPGLSAFIVC